MVCHLRDPFKKYINTAVTGLQFVICLARQGSSLTAHKSQRDENTNLPKDKLCYLHILLPLPSGHEESL